MTSYEKFSSEIDIQTSDSEKETLEIKKKVEKNKNNESFIVLIKISYSSKFKSLVYKIDESHIRFDIKRNFLEEISKKTYFDFEIERLKKIYNGRGDIKINLFVYFLNDLEFSILKDNFSLDSLE